MTTFLGPVGSLIPVKCASQLTSSGGRDVSFTRTLGKQKAFLGQVRAREWQVDIGLAKPSELSGLRWLAENVNSPMVWYGPDAVVGNILPPDQAALAPGTHRGLEGPLAEVEPGVWVKSVFVDTLSHPMVQLRNNSLDLAPVPAESFVTASAWMAGSTLSDGQRIRVEWSNAEGQTIGAVDEFFVASATLKRRSVTVQAPAGAALMRMMPSAMQVAGPAVTLTDKLMPYSPGKGAKRVVVHGLSDAVIRATDNQQLESLSFTISEVG